MIARSKIIFLPALLLGFFFTSCAPVATRDRGTVCVDYFYGQGNEWNSFDGTFTHNRIGAQADTVRLSLTQNEQDRILRIAMKVQFFEMHDTITDNPRGVMLPDNPIQFLRIKWDTLDKKVIWHQPDFKFNPECFRLKELTDTLHNIFEMKR